MTPTAIATDLLARSTAARDAVTSVTADPLLLRELDDAELLQLTSTWSEAQKAVGAQLTVVAGEIARRSTPALGLDGLAQRNGFRTPEKMVELTTGVTKREAVEVVRIGRAVEENASGGSVNPVTGEIEQPREPWLADAGAALVGRELSPAQLTAIRNGLGTPIQDVTVESLASAVVRLVRDVGKAAASGVPIPPEQLLRTARDMRDLMDEVGIADREEARYQQRGARIITLGDGRRRLIWDLDDATDVLLTGVIDRATSPKRGGVSFVDPDVEAQADSILKDDRSWEQLAADALHHAVKAGIDADDSQLLGSGAPRVTVLVDVNQIRRDPETPETPPVGHGFIEAQRAPIPAATVEELLCEGLMATATINTAAGIGQPLELGRDQRLFSPKQRQALALRDGGCMWPGCDRPPSWTEAHHIYHWLRDHGNTDVKDGMLFCRHHHRLLHHGWNVVRDGARYYLVPPTTNDPTQTPRLLASKSRAWNEALSRPRPRPDERRQPAA